MLDNEEVLSPYSQKIKDKIWKHITQQRPFEDDLETWKNKNSILAEKHRYWVAMLYFTLKILSVIIIWRIAYCSWKREWLIKIVENLIEDSNLLLKMFINVIPNSDNKKCAILCVTLIAIIFIKNKYSKK